MLTAYTKFDVNSCFLVFGSLFGLIAAGALMWIIEKDRAALRYRKKRTGVNDSPKNNVNLSAFLAEGNILMVHVFFLWIGLLTMFQKPGSLSHFWNEVLRWGFILVPLWLGVRSVVNFILRKRLDRMVAK